MVTFNNVTLLSMFTGTLVTRRALSSSFSLSFCDLIRSTLVLASSFYISRVIQTVQKTFFFFVPAEHKQKRLNKSRI